MRKSNTFNVAFRVDASSKIGTGHLMRCLTLADELKEIGCQTRFVCRHLPEHFRTMLTTKGHEYKLIHAMDFSINSDDLAHAEWLGASQETDAADTIHILSDKSWDWLIVDHYALDKRWQTLLRKVSNKILVIDDIADRQHDCDILLDQNYYLDMNVRYAGKVPEHCLQLLGPRYALLRKEYRALREKVAPRTGSVKRILIFFGGVDENNYTEQAIGALLDIGVPGVHIDVVIGASHPNIKSIKTSCASLNSTLHIQTERMAELIAAADLAIGAGGVSIWERCCLGLPALVICAANNQRDQIIAAAEYGLLYMPMEKADTKQLIKLHVNALLENHCLISHFSQNGMQAVDGKGAIRITRSMSFCKLEIRTAEIDDTERLYTWRNHPVNRQASRNSDFIPWEEHKQWFESVLKDPDRLILIGQYKKQPVGVVRFDIRNEMAEVSIYMAPETKNAFHGHDLLHSAEIWMARNCPNVKTIQAHVLGENDGSHRLFLASGYKVKSTHYTRSHN